MKDFDVNQIDVAEYIKLFNTNMEGVEFNNVISEEQLKQELTLFNKSTIEQQNYLSTMTLKDWGFVVDGEDVGDRFESIDRNGILVLNKHIFEYISSLDVNSILDAGAGGGMNTKILSTKFGDRKVKFYCVENHKNHCEIIKSNFGEEYDVNKPYVKVPNAEVINASLHNIPLEDNSVDLVFSHAVMSHIPYIPAVCALKELSRVTSKYIVHVEQKNSVFNIVVPGYTTHESNRNCTVNYSKIYENLGFKQINYLEVPLGVNNQIMCVYVGEKIKS